MDGEVGLYEAPQYAETRTCWRLQDGTWLMLQKVFKVFDSGAVTAIITNDAVNELDLQAGSAVVALVKAGHVLVGVPA